jgi:hypothetical protein
MTAHRKNKSAFRNTMEFMTCANDALINSYPLTLSFCKGSHGKNEFISGFSHYATESLHAVTPAFHNNKLNASEPDQA